MMVSTRREPLDYFNMPGVVEIVGGHAGNQSTTGRPPFEWLAIESAGIEVSDRGAQRAMHLFEQRDVGAPRLERRLLRTDEPVGSFQRKRPACRGRQSSP